MRSFLRTLARYWWLLLALAAVGAIAGGGITFLQEETYEAESSVYLGQPTDANGDAIAGPNSDPEAGVQIVTAESTLKDAVKLIGEGESLRNLRDNLVVSSHLPTVKGTTSPANFVTITVSDQKATRAAKASNVLAGVLVERLSGYAEAKLALLRRRIQSDDVRLAELDLRAAEAQGALDAIAAGRGSDEQKALASTPYIAIAQAAASQTQAVLDDKRANELAVRSVKGIELPRILTPATTPTRAEEPQLKLSAAAGMLVGLVAGAIVALLFDHRRRRAAGIA